MKNGMEFLLLLKEWTELKQRIETECKPLIEQEMALRKTIFTQAFPKPTEGTNSEDLPEGWVIKGVYKLERKIDPDVLPAIRAELQKQEVNLDTLIRWKPELETKAYKALNETARAIFDNALTIKPSSPTLELHPPKPVK
jgi:hypothetical protein